MGWLIRHDLIPAWTAQDVPAIDTGAWLPDERLESQARIEDKFGRRVGTVWTIHRRSQGRVARRDVFWIQHFSVLPPLRIEVESDFSPKGRLDEFHLQVFGVGQRVEIVAEDYSGNLAFRLWVGRRDELFKVDASAVGMLGDVFRPFPVLPNIEVGQSWRLHVVNPLAAISGFGSRLIPMVVTVTGRDNLPTPDGAVDCFVVETDQGAKAWVDDRGTVLKQQMEMPVGGLITVVAEPFDEKRLVEVQTMDLPS